MRLFPAKDGKLVASIEDVQTKGPNRLGRAASSDANKYRKLLARNARTIIPKP